MRIQGLISIRSSCPSKPIWQRPYGWASAPQRIEQGVEFSLQLDGVPHAARISFTESGLPWTQHFVLWINQQRAGLITPSVPDLQDAGFTSAAAQPHVGWREGPIYLPVALLKTGLNSVQLSVENDDPAAGSPDGDDAGSNQPLAVNHLIAQFDFGQVEAGTGKQSRIRVRFGG
jgi:hypothetical protein